MSLRFLVSAPTEVAAPVFFLFFFLFFNADNSMTLFFPVYLLQPPLLLGFYRMAAGITAWCRISFGASGCAR